MPRHRKAGATMAAMIDDIHRATKGRHMRWVMVDEVARCLQLDDAGLDAAIRQAETKGLLVAEGESVALGLPEGRRRVRLVTRRYLVEPYQVSPEHHTRCPIRGYLVDELDLEDVLAHLDP